MTFSNYLSEARKKEGQNTTKASVLYLYNDDINTFDHVIECLIEICNHDFIQAEQCAYIANCRGKCDIKKGEYSLLKALKTELLNKGLIVTIE